MESWQPFPDTVPALRAAKDAGLGLWIISNTDRAIMDHTLRHLELDFDGVTVAEDVRAYKPGRALRQSAARHGRLAGRGPARRLRLQVRHRHGEFGFQTAWVNRHRDAGARPEQPDHEWTDLWLLAEVA